MAKPVDIDQLNEEIKSRLGINLKEYRNEEVAENIIDMLVFPIYALTWIIQPILIFLVLFVVGYFLMDLTTLEIIAYSILGLILMILCGLFAGFLYFIRRLKMDVSRITNYAMNLMKAALKDSTHWKSNLSKEQQEESMQLLFKGIIHIVILPVVSKVLSNKIPVLGMMVSGFVERILSAVANRVSFEGEEHTSNQKVADANSDDQSVLTWLERVDFAEKGIQKIVHITSNIARIPMAILFWICFIILVTFLYLIY